MPAEAVPATPQADPMDTSSADDAAWSKLNEKLDATIVAEIQKRSAQLSRDLLSLTRNATKHATVVENLKLLGIGRFPSGIKLFQLGAGVDELDTLLAESKDITIKFDLHVQNVHACCTH